MLGNAAGNKTDTYMLWIFLVFTFVGDRQAIDK